MIVADRVSEPFNSEDNTFYHGFTFAGHPAAAAAALENLDIFEEEDLNGRVRENSPLFRAELEKLLDIDIVGDVRGEGYFFGIELVKDKATKETFNEAESRSPAARLPLPRAVGRRPVLPRRRPGRPRHPARSAADHWSGRVR